MLQQRRWNEGLPLDVDCAEQLAALLLAVVESGATYASYAWMFSGCLKPTLKALNMVDTGVWP